MAYYLTIEQKRGTYTPINIVKSVAFARLSKLKGTGASLEEIDIFTSQFNDGLELCNQLFKEHLITSAYLDKPISIRKLYQGKYIKVLYDMLYQKDIEYIIDPMKVVLKVDSFLFQGDYRFIEKFANHYMDYFECSSTAPEVRDLAKNAIRVGYVPANLCERDENGDNPVVRMTRLLIYDHYQNQDGRVFYKDTIKYRNLHSIIAFINNYEKTYLTEKSPEDIEIKNTDVKKKTRKKDPIDGQYSLF